MDAIKVNRMFPWSDLGLLSIFFPNRSADYYQLNCSDMDGEMSWSLSVDPAAHTKNNLLVTHWVSNAIISLWALILNLSLMYLINDRSGQMSRMRPLLNYSCALDILLAFVCLISGPFLHVTQGHFTTIWNGLMPADSHALVRFGIGMAWSLIIGSWGLLPLQFVYRLDVIRHSNGKKYKKAKYYVYAAFGFLTIFSASILAFEMNFSLNAKYAWSAVRVLRRYGLEVKISWISGGYTTDLEERIYAHYFTFMLFFGYLVIVYTEFMRQYYVNRMLPVFNHTNRRMHEDMNRTFVSLALCPLFTSVLPAIFINKAVNSCYVPPNSLLVLSLAVTAAPLINAVVTIIFIRPYRSAFLGWMGLDDYTQFERRYHASLATNIGGGPV